MRSRAPVAALLALALGAGAAAAGEPTPPPVHPPDEMAQLFPGLKNPSCPLPGLATGGQLEAGHIATLAAEGYRAVFDVRDWNEARGYDERATVERAGMRYLMFPVGHDTIPDERFTGFRRLMRDGRNRPAMVHCSSGNRVGAVLVPHLVLDRGVPLDSALAMARRGGLRGGALERQALDYVRRQQGR
jgi:protein tyrosine phosphatase (PTP) superfamily phosphohydrolase (DUF442 family)